MLVAHVCKLVVTLPPLNARLVVGGSFRRLITGTCSSYIIGPEVVGIIK